MQYLRQKIKDVVELGVGSSIIVEAKDKRFAFFDEYIPIDDGYQPMLWQITDDIMELLKYEKIIK